MIITQIRNATVKITYGGVTFLIDPLLGPKGTMSPYLFSVRQDCRNPLFDLPFSAQEVLDGVDAVIFTHLHSDHVDKGAYKLIPKDMKVFAQNKNNKWRIERKGFTNVEVLSDLTTFKGISMTKIQGQHGQFPYYYLAGNTCGIVFRSPEKQTLYLAGDTIWYSGVEKAIETYNPKVIVVNGGGNKLNFGGLLIMGTDDIKKVHDAAPNSIIISTHMEGVNHWSVSRKELADFAKNHKFANKLRIPLDGEVITDL